MNKTVSHVIFACCAAVFFCASIYQPKILGDSNEFLAGFVNHNLLGFMGVLVTISLASSANIHLEIRKIEKRTDGFIFRKTRQAVEKSAISLIVMLILSLVISVLKPVLNVSEHAASILNSLALLIVVFAVLVLIDLTILVFNLDDP